MRCIYLNIWHVLISIILASNIWTSTVDWKRIKSYGMNSANKTRIVSLTIKVE